jgi:hypothetical protein
MLNAATGMIGKKPHIQPHAGEVPVLSWRNAQPRRQNHFAGKKRYTFWA